MFRQWADKIKAGGAMGIAIMALLAMALQYPLSTTFPIGGDTASYITKSTRILNAPRFGQAIQEVGRSRYPLAQLLLTASAILPLSWPERFIWMMTLGHIVAGGALSWFTFRLTRQPLAAAAALFFWALSTTGIQHHFEDATLAQLWSLPWLILWLESLYAQAWKRNVFFLILTVATHPFSGLLATLISILLLIQIATQRQRDAGKKFLALFTSATLLCAFLISGILVLRPTVVRDSSDHLVLPELVRSAQGMFFLLAPAGALIILDRLRNYPSKKAATIAWLVATVFLAFNDRFHIGVETNRFLTYFLVLAIACAASAVLYVSTHAIPLSTVRVPILAALAGALFLWSWNESAAVYTFYESPSRYARLHESEQAAFLTLADVLPKDSVIISSEANRHAEWLPVFTHRPWYAVPQTDPIWRGKAEDWKQYAVTHHYTHLVVLEHTEEAPAPMRAADNPFPVVYANEGVTVYRLL